MASSTLLFMSRSSIFSSFKRCFLNLVKNTYKDKEGKEKDILSYGIFDVAKKEYIYYTEGIDVAKRLERDWEFYDDINNPANTNKQLVCTSRPKEE